MTTPTTEPAPPKAPFEGFDPFEREIFEEHIDLPPEPAEPAPKTAPTTERK